MAPHSQPEKDDTPEKPEKGDAREHPIEISSDDEPEPKPPPPPGSMEAFVLEAGRMGVPPGGARERLAVTLRNYAHQRVRLRPTARKAHKELQVHRPTVARHHTLLI